MAKVVNKVFKHRALMPDDYLGRVDAEGKVYERDEKLKLDKYVGHVDLADGKIYDARFDPEKHVGRVEMDNGKVFFNRFGSEEYLGQVRQTGTLYHHKRLALDDYLGKVTNMISLLHGGAALLLLVFPAFSQEELEKKEQKEAPKSGQQPKDPRRK